MKKFRIFVACLLFAAFININFLCCCKAEILSGNVNKEEFIERSNVVVDGTTGNPVAGAEVAIPAEGISTRTNNYGQFNLDASFKGPAILSVKKDGYKPFSVTINENETGSPLIIAVTKLSNNEIIIDSKIHHLGDNKFSLNSANSHDFNLKAEGPYFFKEFLVKNIDPDDDFIIKLGSIIGLDTEIAKRLGQSKAAVSSSTPMNIYLNSEKIGEIKINGDNQEISLPKNLIRSNTYNTVRIETGVNKAARDYIDYDDIEFMNLILVVR